MKIQILRRGVPEDYSQFDPEDYELIAGHTFKLTTNGYLYTYINRKQTMMHRIITNCPSHLFVDHINGNKIDNRKCNLRIVSKMQNCHNQRVRNTNTSGYKGVHKVRSGSWHARVTYNGKRYSAGRHKRKEDAALAYNKLAKELYGEYARPNVVT